MSRICRSEVKMLKFNFESGKAFLVSDLLFKIFQRHYISLRQSKKICKTTKQYVNCLKSDHLTSL